MIKRRSESFFGLHFDFHACPENARGKKMGENLKEEDIRKICQEVKPDFIQIDCKGHPGYASYPTKLGNAMPEFAFDTLALWRKVTAEEGVALYLHYSGIRDYKYLRDGRLDEGAMEIDGTYLDEDVCPIRSKYLDNLMIPQLLELAEYGCDGVWVDGDCWGVKVSYHPDIIKMFEEEYKVSISENPPLKYGDPYFEEYREFHREAFRKYLRRYCDEVHAKYPNFQIASNWAYTEEMPEKVNTPVDFLSGDFDPLNSVENVQFSARIISAQDMHWDLMSWSFRLDKSNKTVLQLKQEASAVMMLGGAYQAYITQHVDGSPKVESALRMKELAEYCRSFEPFSKGIKNLPQVTIFNSTIDHYANNPYPFSNGPVYNSIRGLSKLLSRAGMSFDIREEHNLFDCIDDFPVVVVPEVNYHFGENDVEVFSKYAENGGLLVLTGVETLNLFKERLALDITECDGDKTPLSLGDGFWSVINTEHCRVGGDEIIAYSSVKADREEARFPIATMKNVGKGKVILIGTDIGAESHNHMTVTARRIIEKIFDYYTPLAKVEGSHFCNINIAEMDGKRLVHLFNTSGEHNNTAVENTDEILPIYNLRLKLYGEKPKSAVAQPENIPLQIAECNGSYEIELPPLNIHKVVEVEY